MFTLCHDPSKYTQEGHKLMEIALYKEHLSGFPSVRYSTRERHDDVINYTTTQTDAKYDHFLVCLLIILDPASRVFSPDSFGV